MRMVVVFAFETVEDAVMFAPTYDMELVAGRKLVTSLFDEIDYDGLVEVFEHPYECFIIVELQEGCELIYKNKPEQEAAG